MHVRVFNVLPAKLSSRAHAVFAAAALALCAAGVLSAQTKPLYQLPDISPEIAASRRRAESEGEPVAEAEKEPFLVATDSGLFRVLPSGAADPLWTEGKVERILRTAEKWFFITDKGILSSLDLKIFTECNNGLPSLTIKTYEDGVKNITQQAALLKDISVDPFDSNILVTATKDEVFITYDGGSEWTSLGSSSRYTPGIKAVAVAHMPVYDEAGAITGSELAVFMSHPIYGFSYCVPGEGGGARWVDVSAGFSMMPSLTQVDEVSDILPVLCRAESGEIYTELYVAQSFMPNIYRFDWRTKRAEKIYEGAEAADTIDALCQCGSDIIFTTVGKVQSISLNSETPAASVKDLESFDRFKSGLTAAGSFVNAAFVPAQRSLLNYGITLGELWLLSPGNIRSAWAEKANKRKALYASVYQLRNDAGIEKYRKIISDNKLNAVVIDMKDDYGLLRFEPESELLKEKGFVTQYKVDLDKMVSDFKADGVYLIARIVVFKDRNLAAYDGGKYAVWNSRTDAPWVGFRGTEDITDENGNVIGSQNVYYDENWVDPYCEEVWEYNIEIAKELVRRGFDEIQFDYIRFPTDGTNLGAARYRWQDEGMDKESALISFLSYARRNIDAPIGIDIYGANGWYRSGSRTGQDVELLSEYVDVICPMFYPSHFEQEFLEYEPREERPYNIYFYGSYRNTVIGRNRVIVRPWVQAFYMGVRYDREFYNKDYVLREIFGVRDGVDRGYMYWNNSGGNYDDISPDPEDNEISPWHAAESDLQERLPAFSLGGERPEQTEEAPEEQREHDMISVWNSVLDHYEYESPPLPSSNFLNVPSLPQIFGQRQ